MKEFWDVLQYHVDEITFQRVLVWLALGLVGGAVRVCKNEEHQKWRTVVSSIMVSIMAGGLVGALLHESISDPIYHGAICAIGGYSGQLTLVLIDNWYKRIVKGGLPK